MDEVTIDGKTYVSSKRAAVLTGYAKDYIGQLCREGRVEARLVGRSWYVYEPSLKDHRFGASDKDSSVDGTENSDSSSEKPSIQAVWEEPVYRPEEVTPLPEITSREQQEEPTKRNLHVEVQGEKVTPSRETEGMQSAWESWFEKDPEENALLSVEENSSKIERETAERPTYFDDEGSGSVPVRVLHDISPRNAVDPLEPQKQVVRESSLQTGHKPKKDRNVVLKAVLVAIMLLSISIAVVGLGVPKTISWDILRTSGFVLFLEGTDIIK